ncbi:ABC transporter permease [Evansella sp. AB-rgal1]|uniref:ABC transporter permease n=1 Tax=Evansella sp. AB-rgal1 TaxID=3242696 RepID=UPI00359E7A75
MRNSMKVAKWEIKRNLKNKTFVIGLFITPIIIIAFMLLGSFFGGDDEFQEDSTTVFVNDQLGVFPHLEETVSQTGFLWELEQTDSEYGELKELLQEREHTALIVLDEQTLDSGVVSVYTSEEINPYFLNQVQVLEGPLLATQLQMLGLTAEELEVISRGVSFDIVDASNMEEGSVSEEEVMEGETEGFAGLDRAVPGAFAGFIMLSIVFTGMAIFQSASQEKKDKIAEIILASITPGELMQGKIYGYFVLGLIQAFVSIVLLVPFFLWRMDMMHLLEHLFVPELLFFVTIAILGYLLFAALFVGVGATMADMTTAGNFQGMVMMLPFLPFIFIGPVFSNPSGLMAQIGTYIPFTSPGVLLMRLSILEEWPWIEISISLVILLASIWIFMKLAGKIFQVGILMYGKNATPGEIWKWIRA